MVKSVISKNLIMEEFEYKLSSRDPILILNGVKSLVDRIKILRAEKDKNEYQRYFRMLKDKCLYGNQSVAMSCIYGLISLCDGSNNACTTVDTLLHEFVAAIPHAKNLIGIIHLIFYALGNSLEGKEYGIMYNQHPLITIIKCNGNTWPTLFIQIRELFRQGVLMKCNMSSFLLYVLYDFDGKMNNKFQNELLDLFKSTDVINPEKIILLTKDPLVRTTRYCQLLADVYPPATSYLIICVRKMIEQNLDASEAILILSNCFYSNRDNSSIGVELVLLSECLSAAPIRQLMDLLELCFHVLNKNNTSLQVMNVLKSILICWKLQFPVFDYVTKHTNTIIDHLLLLSPNTDVENKKAFTNVLNTKLFLIQEMLCSDINLELFLQAPIEVLQPLFNVFLGILYGDSQSKNVVCVIKLLLKCVKNEPNLSPRLLPVILYRLANCIDPAENLALLRALPQTAVKDENLAMIVTTLKAISKGPPHMRTMALSVIYDLVCIDLRCFPYLQELLAQENPENFLEYEITKAYVVKELCRKKIGLQVYRAELTVYLSRILSETRNLNYGLPQALAFEGLKYLCQNDIIDPASAWYTLAPKFENDTRDLIIINLCEMIGGFSKVTEVGPDFDKLVEEVLKKLWDYTRLYSDKGVLKAAYKALSAFTLEQVSLAIPEVYSEKVDLFGCIGGHNWLNVLTKCPSVGLPFAADLLISLISKEIHNYRRGIYDIHEQHGEPRHFNLPSFSILGAVGVYVKGNYASYTKKDPIVFLECLRILSKKYAKPLPPMDWCFLQEIVHDEACQEYCITIASNQAALSGSARRLMDNYIVAITDRNKFDKDIIYVYKNIKSLCNSIQPIVMRPFMTSTMNMLVANVIQNQPQADEDLKVIIAGFKSVLIDKSAPESNKNVISEVIVSLIENMNHFLTIFESLLPCVCVLPMKYLDKVSSPNTLTTCNELLVSRCLRIRCAAAMSAIDNPFTYLDCFVDCRALKVEPNESNVLFTDLYKSLKPIFTKFGHHQHCINWLIELMTKIQLDLADERDMRRVLLQCTIFVLAICFISGFYIFRDHVTTFEELGTCFPYGLESLLKTTSYSTYVPQILEWLYDIGTNLNYKRHRSCDFLTNTFKMSLLLLREQKYFNENCKWMKYIEVEFC